MQSLTVIHVDYHVANLSHDILNTTEIMANQTASNNFQLAIATSYILHVDNSLYIRTSTISSKLERHGNKLWNFRGVQLPYRYCLEHYSM